jgi:hypothetical protein
MKVRSEAEGFPIPLRDTPDMVKKKVQDLYDSIK